MREVKQEQKHDPLDSRNRYDFCTYFDRHYLARGLALIHSLRQQCPGFRLWVLCLDVEAHQVLEKQNLPGVCLITLEEFELNDPDLFRVKTERSAAEYYFTCTPSLPLFVLKQNSDVDLITYLDADLFFFSSPAPLFGQMDGHSIGIIEHRFTPKLRSREKYGIYNVGWVSFRRDEQGLACLRWWRERCLNWCYDRPEERRFADQKYLDDWPSRFSGVVVLDHKGANLAPWNLANYTLRTQGETIFVDEDRLIFFHFHAFKQIRAWLFNSNLASYDLSLSAILRKKIYSNYLRIVREFEAKHPLPPGKAIKHSDLRRRRARAELFSVKHLLGRVSDKWRALLYLLEGRWARQYLFVIKGRIV
jgi:hypothetical protein